MEKTEIQMKQVQEKIEKQMRKHVFSASENTAEAEEPRYRGSGAAESFRKLANEDRVAVDTLQELAKSLGLDEPVYEAFEAFRAEAKAKYGF